MSTLLQEILKWSNSRPAWQRDALRRIIQFNKLEEKDISELTEICKSKYGLSKREGKSQPLEKKHLPNLDTQAPPVTLKYLKHESNVNALAPDQTIIFGKSLNVIYGKNASGKSGYSRILKSACRTRGAEEILGNVLSEQTPGRPTAEILFLIGDEEKKVTWNDERSCPESLGRISVFDVHCASVYINEKTDVTYRPFGLDLFDHLSVICEKVREILEEELSLLKESAPELPNLPEDTESYKIVSNLTALTDLKELQKFATLSTKDESRLKELDKQIKILRSTNPQKASKELRLRADRLLQLYENLSYINKILNDKNIKALKKIYTNLEKTRTSLEKIKTKIFSKQPLNGTGSDEWRELWETARIYSEKYAYPNKIFPFTGKNSLCVLCHQKLSKSSIERLNAFEKFLRSNQQKISDELQERYEDSIEIINKLSVDRALSNDFIEDLALEDEKLSKSVIKIIKEAKECSKFIKTNNFNHSKWPFLPDKTDVIEKIKKISINLQNRSSEILTKSTPKAQIKLEKEFNELQSRRILALSLKNIFKEIDRQKRIAVYERALKDTETSAITRKSTELTKKYVTNTLIKAFEDELKNLEFSDVEVVLQPAGGSRGTLYHRLVLKRAEGVNLPKVVSEGESRCLSIASFFSELSIADDCSAIIFDDPVSSLDHNWRENVARRLVIESKFRQVIVFSHDIVFLLALKRLAEENDVACYTEYIRKDIIGAGISSGDLPWPALKVKDRIGVIKARFQSAEKLFREKGKKVYEIKALDLYGMLRETWERAIEEVLLNSVVERYRPNVETQRTKYLADITKDDIAILNKAMIKCSRWLRGHDQAPAENVPIPEPNELKNDIEELENWVKAIRKRRKT